MDGKLIEGGYALTLTPKRACTSLIFAPDSKRREAWVCLKLWTVIIFNLGCRL